VARASTTRRSIRSQMLRAIDGIQQPLDAAILCSVFNGLILYRYNMHVSDLADAHVAAIDWLAAGNPSDSFNLGNGRGFSVAEAVATSEKTTGSSIRTEMRARRPGDPPVLVSDSKARQLLGWTSNFPELDQQIKHAWTWFRKQNAQNS
jgi:UDP-glucose 4-epimerase